VWRFTTEGGVNKGRGCFTPETPVWADGVLVPIAEVRPAQAIMGGSNDPGGGYMSHRYNSFGTVERLQEHNGVFTCYDLVLETGTHLSVVSNHYFMTAHGQWIALRDLRTGVKLRTATGSVTVAGVYQHLRPYTGMVYNLKIEDSDHYLVGADALIARDY
jgi:hypothetical protein